MKKHQLKKLWDRMYLRFKTDRVARERRKEYEFRGRLAGKVADARKFSAESHVSDYLEDFNKELLPKTYEGKRLPEWLIKELIETDKIEEKEKLLRGKDVTSGETLILKGETVEQFIQRNWK